MAGRSKPSEMLLPESCHTHAKCAILQGIALAQYAGQNTKADDVRPPLRQTGGCHPANSPRHCRLRNNPSLGPSVAGRSMAEPLLVVGSCAAQPCKRRSFRPGSFAGEQESSPGALRVRLQSKRKWP